MNAHFQELMRDATRLTRSGKLNEATAAIRQALARSTSATPAPADDAPPIL